MKYAPLTQMTLRIFGWTCVAVGTVGFFLPLLPTTPFLLLALACFGIGSPRMKRRLLRWKFLREFWVNYQRGCGVPRKTKINALFFLWFTLGISAMMKHQWWYWSILGCVGIAVSTHLILLKSKPLNQQGKEKDVVSK